MFTVTLTSYGQTQISDLVQIDGIILLYEYVSDISSISNTSSYTQVLDEDSAGNIKNNICNVLISDSSSSEYQAHTILFYKNNGGTKNILGGYSAEEPFIKKSASAVNLWFSFDFSAFTNGFALSAIKAGFANASHNEDGLLHLENPNTTSDDNYSVYNKSQVDALLQDKQSTLSAGDGIAISNGTVKTTGIPFGIVDNTSTATVFTVTVPGIYKLEDGVCCLLKNGVITSATGFTLEVNGLGAKPVYSNMAAATRETTIFNVNYTMLFVYDSTRIEGGAWICYRGYFSDANSIAYQIRGNVCTLPTTAKFYRYRLLFTSADGTHFVPSNTSTSTNATAKRDVVQTPIDPFGEIVYYSTTTAVEANANPGPAYLWTQYAITFGYSFNRTGATLTLTSFSPVYIKCAPQSNGSAIIDADTPYVQTLPSTADGKIYIFLGVANSATAVELLNNHPIYYHDGTGIRIWHGKDSYSKSELDTIIADYVQTSRTINNKPLTSDITLTLDDISDGTNRSIPTVNNSTIIIKKNSSDTGDSFTTNAASGKTINLGLATVATSGSYNDLSDKPTATVINDSTITIKKNSDDTGDSFTTNNATAKTINLDLHAVATSGSYNDLSNKPTIPTVNDTTITIKKNTSDTGDSFTTNTATIKTINLGLSTVATSGSYNDLSNKPTIPTVNNAKLTIKKDTNDTGTEFTANASSDVTCNLGLHTVATSGSYNDLSNKPTIPTVNNSTITIKKNSSDTGDSFTTNASSGKTINLGLHTVATSGSYNDLSNKPTIPTVNNATLTIQKNSDDNGDTFTANASSDKTINLDLADVASSGSYNDLSDKPTIPTVNNSTITIKKNTNDTGDSFTTNAASGKTINLGLSTVAASGSYNDLSNKPTIPTVNNAKLTIKKNASDTGTEFTANASSDVTCNLNLATVATSGSYNDLSNKPIIPTVNNATLIIQKNGTTVNTFTANASSNVTANITVPTTVAELTDAGNYAQSSSLTSLVATAQYNSTDKTIEFYNASGTKLNTDIDATAFIKDGMVDNVEITGGNLVISFNTDAGKEDIEIPISDIFDASNYYTKSQVDGLIPTVNNAKLTIKKNASDTGTAFTANASTDVTCNLGLAAVATSGSYNDLSNKPTIPTVNNAKLTIKKTSTDAGTEFTANASTDVTCNLGLSTVATSGSYNDLSNKPTIPADTGDLTNNAGFITSSDLPTNHVTTDTVQEITGAKTIAEDKLKIGDTTTNEDIDNFVFKRGQEFIVGTQSSATSLWQGVTSQSAIYEGMCINYLVPVACTSTAVTLELTLPDNTTTGAIPVRRNAANTVTSTHIGVGSVVQLTLLLNRTVGSTTYEKVWKMNESYDSNTNTIAYQLRGNSALLPASDTSRYYKLFFSSADNTKWVPASINSSNNITTARTANQRPINPFGRIAYTSATTNYTAGTNVAAATLWDQYTLNLGYSFGTLSLTPKLPVYIKCAPQSDGSAIIDSTTPVVQSLPSSADNKIYIFLGTAYGSESTTQTIEMFANKPVYYHDGNGIKLWTGSIIPTNTNQLTNGAGFITSSDLPTNHVTTDTIQAITGAKTFVTKYGGGSGNDIKIAFSTNAQHYITVASSAEYNNDHISPYFHMSFIGDSGNISTYIETRATYTHNQLSDEYDLTDIVSTSELSNTWSLGSNRSMLKSIYTNEINNSFTNAISFASTETAFNKEVNLVLAKDTNTYIYGGNELPDNDYRHWWANYDQVDMHYISISISMTGDMQDGTTLEIPINELSSVTPFGKLIVDTTSYNLSIGTTSVTDSLKTIIESGSYSPVENYVFLCFDNSNFPANIIGIVICAELTNQGQTASEKLMFFIQSNDLELVGHQHNPSQGTYFIVNNSGSYSFSNDYNFNYRVIAKTSIKDYIDNKVNSIVSSGVDYATSAGSAYNADTATTATYSKYLTYYPSSGTSTNLIYAASTTSILPIGTSGNIDLGSSNAKFNAIYANSFEGLASLAYESFMLSTINTYLSTPTRKEVVGVQATSSVIYNLIPAIKLSENNVTTNLGSSSYKWDYLYCNYIGNNSNYVTSAYITTINGTTFTGNAATATSATDATNAANVGILGNSTASSYPLVFTNSVNTSTSSVVNKKLYTDTANALSYNPSTNVLSGLFAIPYGSATLSGSTWTVSSVTPNPTTSSDPPTGAVVSVYFGNYNSVENPQLKFGSWNAKPIYRLTSYAGTGAANSWLGGSTVLLRYNGSNWRLLNNNSYPTSTASGTTNIIPSADDTYDLGSSSYRWNNLYAYYVGDSSTKIQYGYFNYCSISTLRNGSNSNLATLTSAGIIPYTDSTSSSTGFDLGSSTRKWKHLYISGGHDEKYIIVDSSGGEPTIRPDTPNYGYLGTSSADWYHIYGRQIHVGSNHVAIPPIAATSHTALGSIQFLRVAIPANTTTGIVSAGTALSSSSYTLMLVTAATGYSYLYFRNNTAPSGTWTTLTDMYYYNSGSSTVYTYVLAYKSA